MPLIDVSNLPTLKRLKDEGSLVLSEDTALKQDIRTIHIGFLNLMPDAALQATERQFYRLIGASDPILQIRIHPFTLPMIPRGAEARAHIDEFYETFDQIKAEGLDALVVTGTNPVPLPPITDAAYWAPMIEVFEWAKDNVTSTLCSCLASHVALIHKYGQVPTWNDEKKFGVFRYKVVDPKHPLVRNMNTSFDVIHVRHRDISHAQFIKAGMKILVESPEVGVHMATSRDGFRLVCMQGHPEYDVFSILKEYRREVIYFMEKKREDYPNFPAHYFDKRALEMVSDFRNRVESGDLSGTFPEEEIAATLENTWTDSARSVVSNWVGLVYQTTHVDRLKLFMDGIDPKNPLGLDT